MLMISGPCLTLVCMQALEVLTEQHGKALLGPRKIMVSTVGVVDRMERCADHHVSIINLSLLCGPVVIGVLVVHAGSWRRPSATWLSPSTLPPMR